MNRFALSAPYALFALALSCTDPRERPIAPAITLTFSPALVVTSPGVISGSLYAFDDDGLNRLRLRVHTSGGAFALDSQVLMSAEFEETRPVDIAVPSGLPVGTLVTLVATVEDYAGFQTTDSTSFSIETGP